VVLPTSEESGRDIVLSHVGYGCSQSRPRRKEPGKSDKIGQKRQIVVEDSDVDRPLCSPCISIILLPG
jgi:hypothetical protein